MISAELNNHLWNASYWIHTLPDTHLLPQYLYTVTTKIWAKRYSNLKASPSFSQLEFSEVVLLFHSKAAWFLPFHKSGLHFQLQPTARFPGNQVAARARTHAHTHWPSRAGRCDPRPARSARPPAPPPRERARPGRARPGSLGGGRPGAMSAQGVAVLLSWLSCCGSAVWR